MNYFEERLGKLEGIKPTLYASYANVEGRSTQGGTLPNQIFMHWDRNNLDDKSKDDKFINDTLWFFAHEVAHLYQNSSNNDIYGGIEESWLHEGHADWLAAHAIVNLYPETESFVVNKIEMLEKRCVEGLQTSPLIEAAKEGRFDLYYSCGLLIHQAIDVALQRRNGSQIDIYALWNEFRTHAIDGDQIGVEAYFTTTQKWTSKKFVDNLQVFINTKQVNAIDTLRGLHSNAP